MRIVDSILLLVAFAGTISFAQTASSDATLNPQQTQAVDAFITTEMAQHHIPGVAVGIYSPGKILLAKGYGLANVELNALVEPETLFESGSVGKQFVAAAVMMLSQDGKLSLDDSIMKYFPHAPETWKPILIKNLLSHTSGLQDYSAAEFTGQSGPFYLRLDFTEDQLLNKIEALPPQWAPGDRWAYSNTNYVLLGILIHRVTGIPYAEFLDKRIFKPLNMTSTRLISQSEIIPNRASGYEMDAKGQLANQAWVSPTFDSTADGSLYINVLDMAKWDAALHGTRLLTQSSLDRMWTVYPLNDGKPNPSQYGFAWWIREQGDHRVIEHGGVWQGFTCDISRYPDDNLTVVVLMNLNTAQLDPGLVAHVIAGLVDTQLPPVRLMAIPDTKPDIAATLAKVLNQVAKGEDVRPLLSDSFAQAITPDVAKQSSETLSNLWPGGSLTLVKRLIPPDTTSPVISLFRVTKGDNALMIVMALDSDGKISMIRFAPNREYE